MTNSAMERCPTCGSDDKDILADRRSFRYGRWRVIAEKSCYSHRADQWHTSASVAPYPQNECALCDAGEGTIKATHSSIVGSPVVHHPTPMLCMKYLKPEHIAILKEAKARREGASVAPATKPIRWNFGTCEKSNRPHLENEVHICHEWKRAESPAPLKGDAE